MRVLFTTLAATLAVAACLALATAGHSKGPVLLGRAILPADAY